MMVVWALTSLLATTAQAAPTTVTHEGRLLDTTGAVLDGTFPAHFYLYPSEVASTPVWQEAASILVSHGFYRVVLGNSTPIDAALLESNLQLWLAVEIGDTEMQRQLLSSVPYAIQSQGAHTLTRTDCVNGQVLRWNTTTSTWDCGAAFGGVAFERWGRTVCPSTATQIYKGWMLTGYYTHMGGPSSIHCGHESPEYAPGATTSGNNDGAILYTMEFETNTRGIGAMSSWHDREGRCVVCEAQASMALMIPMRRTCPAGWTLQYEGYMMGQYHASHANGSEALCVDINTETNHGQAGDQNGGLLYPLEWDVTASGTPYTNNAEVSCVVCTK